MPLLDAGYWHTTYWALNYWNPDYWLHYGTGVTGGDSRRYYYLKPLKPKQKRKTLLLEVKKLLETFM